jgi:hypothetical protein
MKMRGQAEARAEFSEQELRESVKECEGARLAICELHQGKASFLLQGNILHVLLLPVTVSGGDDLNRQRADEAKEAAKRVSSAKGVTTKKRKSMAIAAAGTHKLRALFSMHVEGGAGGSVHNTSPVLVEQGPQPEGGLDNDVGSHAEDEGPPLAAPVPLHAETLCNDAAGGAKEAGSSSRAAKKAKTAGGSSAPPPERKKETAGAASPPGAPSAGAASS